MNDKMKELLGGLFVAFLVILSSVIAGFIYLFILLKSEYIAAHDTLGYMIYLVTAGSIYCILLILFRPLVRYKMIAKKGVNSKALSPLGNSPNENVQKLLEVRDLKIGFPVIRGTEELYIQAVRGVSFSLNEGEVLGIVGESGSGKSVTTSAIPGLLPKNAVISGSIRFERTELAKTPADGNSAGLPEKELRMYRGRKIGMIFQEPGRSFDPLQNMGSVFYETFRNSDPSITKEEARVRAEALLSEAGLGNAGERLGNFPHQFSGGQLQRIGIALALAGIAQGSGLLIADEPTTALDVTIQSQIIALLKKLRRTRGLSIIFISHDIDLVADIADTIMVMYGGIVMERGTTAEIIRSPKHPYTKALLSASPGFGSHYSRERLASIPGRVIDPASPGAGCPFAPRCPSALPVCSADIPKLLVQADGQEVRCLPEIIGI
jgi:oligopeptide/dipeptide ABC transporter ATP-binding protein